MKPAPNKRATGNGGTASPSHAERPLPAVPERYATENLELDRSMPKGPLIFFLGTALFSALAAGCVEYWLFPQWSFWLFLLLGALGSLVNLGQGDGGFVSAVVIGDAVAALISPELRPFAVPFGVGFCVGFVPYRIYGRTGS